MAIIERLAKIEQLDQLIRLKSTGTPVELAEKMNLSERQVRRYIDEMRSLGAEIQYNDFLKSYEYVRPMKFQYGFSLENMKKIIGGNFSYGHFMSVTDFTFVAVPGLCAGNPYKC
jgi:biotin operon repressor